MNADAVRWLAVGQITRAHGVHGEVSVVPLTQVESRFDEGSVLYATEGSEPLTVTAARPHRSRLLVRFAEVADRERADALRGRYLFVPASTAPALAEDEFWTHELIGCEVVTERGRRLGEIADVIHTQANDVWVVEAGDAADTLIPALKDVVAEVAIADRRVVVRDVPGVTEP